MELWEWVTLGLQVLLVPILLLGGRYNAKNFEYNRQTFGSHLIMITMLQVRVKMLERILQDAGLVDFGIEDDKPKVDLVKRDR